MEKASHRGTVDEDQSFVTRLLSESSINSKKLPDTKTL